MKKINKVYSLQFTVYSLMAALLIIPATVFGQDSAAVESTLPVNTVVKRTFEHGVAINNQTVEGLSKKSLDFIIQHRFGVIDESTDLYGFFGPSNIRLGLDYGITSRLSAGVGATKNKMLFDLNWKYVLLRQEKPKGIPVTVTYYGDVARSAQEERVFLNEDSVYKGNNRLSFFHELMIARKFDRISVQAGITYSHYNLVDSLKDQIKDHDFYGAAFVAKYRFSPQSSVMFDCNVPFTQRSFVTSVSTGTANNGSTDVTTVYYPKVNLGLGLEVSTGSHQFQIFICNSNGILSQEIQVYNTNNVLYSKSILFGFNITRQWGM